MDYRNKLGMFTFDDDTQESHMKLIVQNITGQYLNPKQGEPNLTDEESCYDFIRDCCGNTLGGIIFSIVINEDVRQYTKSQMANKKIREFDQKVKESLIPAISNLQKATEIATDIVLGFQESIIRSSPGGYLVGPAAVGEQC